MNIQQVHDEWCPDGPETGNTLAGCKLYVHLNKLVAKENDDLKESLAKMAEEMKVLTGYASANEGWNNACDEIASRIRFTKNSTENVKATS